MLITALCVPVAMLLFLLGMDAFEDLVSRPAPGPGEQNDPGAEN